MKSITTQIEKSRYRRDYLFSRLVTVFGLLVLVTFATLILHILHNAFPLWISPNFERITSYETSNNKNQDEHALYSKTDTSLTKWLGFSNIQNNWVGISLKDCSININSISKQSGSSSHKKFAPNCTTRVLGLIGDKKQFIATLTRDRLIEIHLLNNRQGSFQLELQNSIKLPSTFIIDKPQEWQISLHGQILNINSVSDSAIQSLHYQLGSLRPPSVRFFKDAYSVIPNTRFNQVLQIAPNKMSVFSLGKSDSTTKELIQTIDIKGLPSSVSLSPSGLDLFVITQQENQSDSIFLADSTNQNILTRYTLFNKEGNFVFRETFDIALPEGFSITSQTQYEFDLRHNLVLVLNGKGESLIVNLVTGEIEAQQKLVNTIADSFYDNEQLLIKTKTSNNNIEMHLFALNNLQGMTSYQVLFAKNDYSGYAEQAYIWQTSVSSSLQSPKYSVLPLIMGSMKASVLALIVALPLALGAAIYTAYFAPAKIRQAIKPTIEMLEAIPSVIIGFIAAVWLAPFAEQYLISIFSVVILLPFVVLLIAFIHVYLQRHINQQKLGDWQLLINAILLLFAVGIIFLLSLLITDWSNTKGYDSLINFVSDLTLSKTAIVVSLALGVAITPTIYTLIDDALFEVPDGVKQASFALGATQIQTLTKVVLVVALPSIISAVMLGFGRAFGETMIVLMVTGNTPIANWDLLSGLRTLTSNLAIELQEAPVDSSPYHILFLTAAILFMFTFVVNTIAAILKRRMYRNVS